MSSLFRSHDPFPVVEQTLDQRRATQLLNATMTYARLILRRYGELAPFAFSMDPEGQISRETLEIPRLPRDPERLYKLLTEHVADRIRRNQIQAVALAANVTLARPSQENFTDAILLTIEQNSAHALQITVPYKIYGGQLRNLIPRRITLGQHIGVEIPPHFFTLQG
jgi:hypothetical protein